MFLRVCGGGGEGGGHSCNPAYQLQPLLLKRNDREKMDEEKKRIRATHMAKLIYGEKRNCLWTL